MFAVSGNTGSAPLIGFNVIRDRTFDRSDIGQVKRGPQIQGPMPNQIQTAFGPRQTGCRIEPDGVKRHFQGLTGLV